MGDSVPTASVELLPSTPVSRMYTPKAENGDSLSSTTWKSDHATAMVEPGVASRCSVVSSLASAPSVVALEGDELVAFFYGRPFAPDIAEMQNMLVAASHRRRGLGREIVERAEADLREAGYRAAIGANSVLHRGTSPERCMVARAFWIRMGWRIALNNARAISPVRQAVTESRVSLRPWLVSQAPCRNTAGWKWAALRTR